MSAVYVLLVYGSAAFIALALLYRFRATFWYLHALSVALSLIIGLTPIPETWHVPAMELVTGGVFTLLFLWGICAPLFPKHHQRQVHLPSPHHG